MKISRSFRLSTLLAFALTTSALAGDQRFTYSELSRYYSDILGGNVIVPAGESEDEQDWFELDIDALNALKKSPDLVTAKRRFYRVLDFDPKKQRHALPFYTLESWGSLFHPPVKELALPLGAYVKELGTDFAPERAESEFFNPEFQKLLDRETRTHLTYGNDVALLPNGSSFQQKLRMTQEVKGFFFGIVMVYTCEESTEQLINELAERKKEGADVRMIVEGLYGSTITAGCVKKMREKGIDVLEISDVLKPGSIAGVMHNKFWIRDGEEAIIGGQNMHHSENVSDGFNGMTRDTDLHIRKGPAVTDLTHSYIQLWDRYRKKRNASILKYQKVVDERVSEELKQGQRGIHLYDDWLGNPDTRMNGICRLAVQDSGADVTPIGSIIYRYAEASRDHVFFTSPSIRFDSDGKRELRWQNRITSLLRTRAVIQNVKVDAISNGYDGGSGELSQTIRNLLEKAEAKDKKFWVRVLRDLEDSVKRSAGRGARDAQLELVSTKNIRVWNYFNFIHSKGWYFDRTAVLQGSFNLDNNSSQLNHEAAIVCLDQELREQTERQYALDLANSVPVVSRNGL